MNLKIKYFLLIFCLLVLSGCANAPQEKMDRNNKNLMSLEIGMSKNDVLEIMGMPTLNESYQSLKGQAITIFFYYTQRQLADGNVTKDETTPVVFRDGNLIGWGSEFYEDRKKVEMDINIKNN